MATGSGLDQGKTEFVEEFLSSHQDAYHRVVNDAWVAAGNMGSVSPSLVGKIRSKLGLTGRKVTNGGATEKKAGSAAKGKARLSPKPKRSKGPSKALAATSQPKLNGGEGDTGPGKSAFVAEVLGRKPNANVKAINEDWVSAGNAGTISPSLIYAAKRAFLGGSSPQTVAPKKTKAKSPKRSTTKTASQPTVEAGPKSNDMAAPSKPVGGSKLGNRERVLDRVEDGIDDLIVSLKQLGGMEEALESLRKVRRVVVRSHQG